MPKVAQYDWDKLSPKKPATRNTHGTMDFATHQFIEAAKGSKNGAIKVTKLPNALKCSACEVIAHSRNELNEHWLLEH